MLAKLAVVGELQVHLGAGKLAELCLNLGPRSLDELRVVWSFMGSESSRLMGMLAAAEKAGRRAATVAAGVMAVAVVVVVVVVVVVKAVVAGMTHGRDAHATAVAAGGTTVAVESGRSVAVAGGRSVAVVGLLAGVLAGVGAVGAVGVAVEVAVGAGVVVAEEAAVGGTSVAGVRRLAGVLMKLAGAAGRAAAGRTRATWASAARVEIAAAVARVECFWAGLVLALIKWKRLRRPPAMIALWTTEKAKKGSASWRVVCCAARMISTPEVRRSLPLARVVRPRTPCLEASVALPQTGKTRVVPG
jgi:hypothetical protein